MKRGLALFALVPTAAFAAAPDTGWGQLIGVAALAVWTGATLAFGLAGYGWNANSTRRALRTIVVASIPTLAMIAYALYSRAERSAAIRLSETFAKISQQYIESGCQPITRASPEAPANTITAIQLSVQQSFVPLSVADELAYSPLDRLLIAFSLNDAYRTYLQTIRFRQDAMTTYDETHSRGLGTSGVSYIERQDGGRLFALGRPAFWIAIEPILTDKDRSGVGQFINPRAPEGIVGWYPERSYATHRLEISDKSTPTDRMNWTSRIEARLFRQDTNELLRTHQVFLPLVFDYVRLRTPVRLCSTRQTALVTDRRFDWLSFILREVM